MTNTTRNKILNYKDTVNSIYVKDEISSTLKINPSEYEHSLFIDPHYKYSITGNLRIVGNTKSRKLLIN